MFGLQGVELLRRVGVVALGGRDAALGTAEGFGVSHKCPTHVLLLHRKEVAIPDAGGGGHVATAEPFGAYEVVNEAAFIRGGWLVACVIFGDEGFVVLLTFRGDDVGFGVEAGFQGVLRGRGFTVSGFGASGFFGVGAVGADLIFGGHDGFNFSSPGLEISIMGVGF